MQTMTKSEFARHIRVKPSYVTDLNKQGRLVLDERGRVLVEESIQRIADTKDPAKVSVAARHAAARGAELPAPAVAHDAPQVGSALPESRDYQDSRAKREHFAAEREELAFRKEAGELVEASAVVSVVSDAATILRGKLEALPDLLAPQLAGVQDEQQIRSLLADYIEEALAGVSGQFASMFERVA